MNDDDLPLIDRLINTSLAYWSALLTAHTVILSVAVALPQFYESRLLWQLKVAGAISSISVLLLVLNFGITRLQSRNDHDLTMDSILGLIIKNKNRKSSFIAKARRVLIYPFENIALLGLLILVTLICSTLFLGK